MGAELSRKCCAKKCLLAFSVLDLQEERARFLANVREDHNNMIKARLDALKVVSASKGTKERYGAEFFLEFFL